MSKHFYVVGGEYADTGFTKIAEGKTEEVFGPFTEQEAHDFWRSITGKTVDNAMIRYVVKRDEDAGKNYYVVGGEYADTTFTKPAPGVQLEKYGPFSRKEAMDFWRSITGKTVDNAMARYDIATEEQIQKSA
ncbi:DUF4170 domain-containing protein [Telmatospirillum sp. J64-1]|uniref:DUF4170 domain-containing protein n=1 Tax=Telmatospirillum sp. J64-1 TaxID=2502183 RepID=UPI00115C5B36|nr:DUF4170 domain-containing protein [Telmatospirillum sp. J64-1]